MTTIYNVKTFDNLNNRKYNPTEVSQAWLDELKLATMPNGERRYTIISVEPMKMSQEELTAAVLSYW